jgi:exopolyphosphatase/pppGpp-phosphohydrolase
MLDAIAGGGELAGLKDKRRDLLLPGLSVMNGLMRALACDTIHFSPTALREGMLDFMARRGKAAQSLNPDQLPDVSHAGS